MALSEVERARYARHLLLPELTSAVQEQLLATSVGVARGVDPIARAAACSYLTRAGLRVASADAETRAVSNLGSPDAVVASPSGSPVQSPVSTSSSAAQGRVSTPLVLPECAELEALADATTYPALATLAGALSAVETVLFAAGLTTRSDASSGLGQRRLMAQLSLVSEDV